MIFLQKQSNAKKYPHLDPRYIFINSGFNLRPTDIQAAIGRNQLKRLSLFKKIRKENKKKIINKLKKDERWKNQFKFVKYSNKIDASYMVLPVLLNEKFRSKKLKFIRNVEAKGLETRPIISGNFLNQPSAKLYKLNPKNEKFKGAQKIQDLGFVIGLHTKKISIRQLNFLVNTLFSIERV